MRAKGDILFRVSICWHMRQSGIWHCRHKSFLLYTLAGAALIFRTAKQWRPAHEYYVCRSLRCMDAAIVPMRPDGRKMKKRRPKMKNEMKMRTMEKDRYHCIKP